MAKALEHLRVLDLSRILAGPWGSQVLADMGADVVKIERPEGGDDTRGWGPPFLQGPAGEESRESSYFLCANRGKRSVTVNLASREGQAIIRDMAREADILIENYKVGTLARYGLSYDDLKAINPRLIYCSITGFGQSGPYADLPGYDFVFQGMSGLMSITGQPDGAPGDEPMKSGIAISDIITGMYMSTAVLAAVEHRHISGEGQYIDLSLLDCTTAISSYQAINYFLSGKVPRRLGNAHSNMAPYQVFACAEGNVIVAVGNDTQFQALCRVIDAPDLAANPLLRTVAGRNVNRVLMIPRIAEAMLARTMTEWVAVLNAANVPCGPIYTLDQVFEDPQVRHRGMSQMLPHSLGVPAPTISSPIVFSATPIVHEQSAPLLGEHTQEVLSDWLGLDEAAQAGLRARGAI